MRELIPKDDFGVFADNKDTVRADSLYVAEMFGKRHDDVLKSIRNLDCSEEFRLRNFAEISYKDSCGRKQKCYYMTRDGFTYLVMGYRGKKAARFKEQYIQRFNDIEATLRELITARTDYPLLTEQIKLLHDDPKPYHYSNECDMLNRLVIGMSAKQFRELHGIEKGKSIRPYMTPQQIDLMEKLQKLDYGLMVGVPDFEERKKHLERCKEQILAKQIAA